MEKSEYKLIYEIEDYHWWYYGLRELARSFIEKSGCQRGMRLLDAGCGSGGFLESCKEYKPYGMDFSEEAVKYCKKRNLANIIIASVNNIPFIDYFFNVVISLDVLYHRGVSNDADALKEFYRVLNNRGILILNLPAYDFLYGNHDKAVHTRHRYNKQELRQKIEDSGFKIEKITYRNTILFPFAFLKRYLLKRFFERRDEPQTELAPLPRLVNTLLAFILSVEQKLLISGINFPFGLSVFCVCRKIR